MKNSPSETKHFLLRIHQLLIGGDAGAALSLIEKHGFESPELKNARGVCLLRLGKIEQALQVFRRLAIDEATGALIQDRPVAFKTNLAVALLLSNNLHGCVGVLKEMNDLESPGAVRIKKALEDWKRTLNPFQRLFFNLYRSSSGKPVNLDFPPGDLTDPSPDRRAF